MLMTTDRLCMHTRCNHIIIPTGQFSLPPSVGEVFPLHVLMSCSLHTVSYKHHNLMTHNNAGDTSPVFTGPAALV